MLERRNDRHSSRNPENDAADEGDDLVIGNFKDKANNGAHEDANRNKLLPQRGRNNFFGGIKLLGNKGIIKVTSLDQNVIADGREVDCGNHNQNQSEGGGREKAHGLNTSGLKGTLRSQVGRAAYQGDRLAHCCFNSNTHQQIFRMQLAAGFDSSACQNRNHQNHKSSVGNEAGDNAGEHAGHENSKAFFFDDFSPENLGSSHIHKAGNFKGIDLDRHTDEEDDGGTTEVGIKLGRFDNARKPEGNAGKGHCDSKRKFVEKH